MCTHEPRCPSAAAPDHTSARVVARQDAQGWSVLCNKVVVFDGTIPANAVRVAVFTRRSIAPDDLVDIVVDDGPILDRLKKQRGARRSDSDPVLGFVLDEVTDDQPIARLELHDAAGLAVALGPRLAPVT